MENVRGCLPVIPTLSPAEPTEAKSPVCPPLPPFPPPGSMVTILISKGLLCPPTCNAAQPSPLWLPLSPSLSFPSVLEK